MKTSRFLSLAAIFATALAFFACSNEADPPPPSPGGEQSGNGEQQQVFCKLNAGNCSQMSLSTCMELVNAGAAQIVSNCTTDPEPQPSSSSTAPPPPPSSSSVAPPPQPSSSSVAPPPPVSSSSRPSSSSVSSSSVATLGIFTDARDSKAYWWVRIGTQIWMGENLNYTPTSGSSKCPDNLAANCTKYGRQYDWATAMGLTSSYNSTLFNMPNSKRQGVCPTGWHLPSGTEWSTLVTSVGTNPGTKLKAKTGWPSGSNGTDNYNFEALPGGYVEYGSVWDSYYDVGTSGYWWTATEYSATNAYNRMMDGTGGKNSVYTYGDQNKDYSFIKQNMLSVRCVKD